MSNAQSHEEGIDGLIAEIRRIITSVQTPGPLETRVGPYGALEAISSVLEDYELAHLED